MSLCTIIDIEFSILSKNKKTPKEVAIYHVDTKQVQNWIIKPSIPFHKLDQSIKVQNIFAEQNFHRIKYNTGHITKEDFENVIREVCQGRKIFVKGSEKSQFVANLLKKEVFSGKVFVYNLDKVFCPKVSQITVKKDTIYSCLIFQHQGTNFNHCAQSKALKFGRWLEKQDFAKYCIGSYCAGLHLQKYVCDDTLHLAIVMPK